MNARLKESILWGVVGLLTFLVLLQGYELLENVRVDLAVKAGTAVTVAVATAVLTYLARRFVPMPGEGDDRASGAEVDQAGAGTRGTDVGNTDADDTGADDPETDETDISGPETDDTDTSGPEADDTDTADPGANDTAAGDHDVDDTDADHTEAGDTDVDDIEEDDTR